MIKFFRGIRQKLLSENKFSKYLLYAVGEIVLVVIGILIALQINTWNEEKKDREKEQVFLKQIKTSLFDDRKNINDVFDFNRLKEAKIDSVYQVLDKFPNPEKYAPLLAQYMFVLTEFSIFEPNKIVFENVISSESIDLISDLELRNNLSLYYKKDFMRSTQERVKELTREFTDYVGPLILDRQTFKHFRNYDSALPNVSEINIHKDKNAYAYLFSMQMSIRAQNELLESTQEEIDQMVILIDKNITSEND